MAEHWHIPPMGAYQTPYPKPSPMGTYQSSYSTYLKPKVGLGVVCRCPANSVVQCLLQRRGPNSASPHKWSFPGGRLEQPGDLEDDGDVGTKRELEEECGGGIPPGLPPLIHIECCKSGKQKQTLYHVYVVDTSVDKEWEKWQPKSRNGKGTEIDTSPIELFLQGQSFPCANGYCWVDMSVLIQECYELISNVDLTSSELQHGLVRWVQNYGEHVLKTLLARSPKLPHPRRYSNSSSSSGSLDGSIRPRPRADSGGKTRKFTPPRATMLQPPLIAGHFIHPPYHPARSPTGAFYSLVPNPSQLSPPGGGLQSISVNQHGIMVPVPSLRQLSPQQHQGLIYVQPTSSVQPSAGSPITSSQEHSQPASPGIQGSSPTAGVESSFPEATPIVTTAPQVPGLVTTGRSNPPVAHQVGQLPASLFEQHRLVPTPNGFQDQTVSPTSHFGTTLAQTVIGRNESEPLLPSPPTSTLSFLAQQLPSLRKEIVCRHYIAGQCPYGEKCWFAHPQPLIPGQTQHREPSAFSTVPQTSIPSSPLHIQVPHNVWVSNPNLPVDIASQYVASPPQSPLGAHMVSTAVRPPILSHLLRQRSPYPVFPTQQPLLFLRPPVSRLSGSAPLLPTGPFPGVLPAVPSDPVLRFSLLSEVIVRWDDSTVVTNISQLATRADHFYISFMGRVRDYKVLFGGNRSYQESSALMERHAFPGTITCLHCSKLQPALLVIGTDSGSIYMWDLKRGPHGSLTAVHPTESFPAVTSLIHFMTSTLNTAQVVVAGNRAGIVSWYISQPPQKTFSLLFITHCHTPHPVISLEILGGFLISGSQDGIVVLWSMRSQQPTVDSRIQAHPFCLNNIHVLDSSHFLTVGLGSAPGSQEAIPPPSHVTPLDTPVSIEQLPLGSSQGTQAQAVDSITSEIAQLSVTEESSIGTSAPLQESSGYCITLWQFNRPPRNLKTVSSIGEILSTSFHHQTHMGNMFLAVGLREGTVKIFNIPNFSVASELHFPEMKDRDCVHVALNLSREAPLFNNAYFRNPFRDLILTTVWSDGKVMVCQVAKQ